LIRKLQTCATWEEGEIGIGFRPVGAGFAEGPFVDGGLLGCGVGGVFYIGDGLLILYTIMAPFYPEAGGGDGGGGDGECGGGDASSDSSDSAENTLSKATTASNEAGIWVGVGADEVAPDGRPIEPDYIRPPEDMIQR
jgi:hypothetical protein